MYDLEYEVQESADSNCCRKVAFNDDIPKNVLVRETCCVSGFE